MHTTETPAPALIPCPFCGSANIDPAEWSGNDGKFGPGCGDCGALAESADLWNTRVSTAQDTEGDLRTTIRAMATALNNGEWANFVTEDDDLSALDAEISHLVGFAALGTAKPALGPGVHLVPKWAGSFHSYLDWVNKAQSRLASPDHRRAMCVDAKGRRCAIGADFMRARDEGAFPVRYFWECELVSAPTVAPADQADKLEQLLIEKRIELVPEYEGGWRANVYRDSDEPQATAASTTPSAAVKAALKSAAPEGAEGAAS